ncbi:MAG: LysR family transcriptional regulator [Alphaproteobacteria bacterium]|jgi:DNA-binding transcriptional LysR family regulator|nr:LysR family transcriptional regulator [Alphaproteobacteria bacterium]MBU2042065.1 LysR family transcriptional regulator [Alphaproteobacteria bacterium]MBU2126064.1 LysR family transcriptional regulator [Alphaproteobacteria bacterium]MBU2209382.1 LysR family transcriptional regulator [Alphaproteobacteria bacterium]MBU2290741.1 LysR family transcriptional regulator [Alphaproteobacteria bacterium]
MKTMDWNHIRAFHATAIAGSLSAAARQLGLTQPTLSRQVVALESDLDVTLFERRGRKLILTQTGLELLDHIRIMGDAADMLAVAASGRAQEISGRVCISATDTFAAYILPEIVGRIRSEAPQITIAIVASNAFSDLHRGEADIAIRNVRPDRPGLVGRHIRDSDAGFFASGDWVARNGLPNGPADLANAAMMGFDDPQFASHLREIGIPITTDDLRIVSESSLVVWEMAKRGMGAAVMIYEVAERTPGMVNLLPDMAPIPVPIWLVTHQELESSPRIRLVQAIMAEELARI